MLDSDMPIIATLNGRYFEVLIWRCPIPQHHRAFIRVQRRAGGAEGSEIGLDCNAAQVADLHRLTKITSVMLAHLDEGGSVETWHGDDGIGGSTLNHN